jgi:hypothetical protein
MSTNLSIATPLQQILGTDKKNPVFSVFRDARHEVVHVYYGAELLETVADDREHTAYKLLVGRLYNAGVNREALRRAFNADPKTMRIWDCSYSADTCCVLVNTARPRDGF